MSDTPSVQPHPNWNPPGAGHTRRRLIGIAGLFVVGLTASACGGSAGDASEAASSSTSEAAADSSSAVPAPVVASNAVPPPAPVSTRAAVDFAMPNLVGIDLQTAQNEVQTHGVFLSKSHDLLGSRHQVVDSNWIVCDQNIPPGQQVTGEAEGAIDFGVVKREETCP